ncbi:torsin-1A-interacting protein 2-like [Eriocheir sinensis]|uniref:torsin-1A-interacting protein 2-like n=1 Tax=Eriocheir sinensis TaxID=95602 RepID=UPI0021C739E6|nr:torsin-1A-interacting protein 2-like [Eriocheir sinensis]XP_050720786.1 torsin-1A-interacting protein 2-like [Eriocheir sinensis]
MATTRRGLRGPRSSSGSRDHGRTTPPPAHDDILTHKTDDDDDTTTRGNRSRGTGKNSSPTDLPDGTTQRHPHGSPSTPPGRPGPTSLHTSGHTRCTSTTTTTTRRRTTTREEEEAGEEVLEAAAEGRGKGTTTTPTKHQHSHHPHHHHQGPTPMLLIFVCFLVLVGIYSLHQALKKREEEERAAKKVKPIADVYEDLKLELQTLNREFSQPREVWLGLLGQLEAMMVDEPPQPAVLLMVVPDDSRGAASCLAHHLAKAVQYAFEDSRFVMFDTRTSQYMGDSAALKLDLDRTLSGLSRAHAAVVHNVESLPGHAAMILHAYCDNENAPYKQAVIFLLAEVPGTYQDLAYSRLDSLVDAHLEGAWGDGDEGEGEAGSSGSKGGLKEKDVSALISRTANAPLLIRPERPARVMELCPV